MSVTLSLTFGTWKWLNSIVSLEGEYAHRCLSLFNPVDKFAIAALPVTAVVLDAIVAQLITKRHDNNPRPSEDDGLPMLLDAGQLQDMYDVGENGFLPSSPPGLLAEKYYEPWETLSRELASLNRDGKLHESIMKMPLLETSKLTSRSEFQRAYVLLGQLVHSWVHSHKVNWKDVGGSMFSDDNMDYGSVPDVLAIPWYNVCKELELPCILVAAGLDAWNWRKIDSSKGFDVRNLTCLSTCTGTDTEIYFHMIPTSMHARFAQGKLPLQIFNMPYYLAKKEVAKIIKILSMIADSLDAFRQIFLKAKEPSTQVKVDTFYNIYRPLLGGFWPDGITLCGVGPDNEEPIKAKGPSAGQSTMFLVLDLILGIQHHSSGAKSESSNFQAEMLKYMPPKHVHFVTHLGERIELAGTTLLEFIHKSHSPALEGAYNRAIKSLKSFRSYHLGVATKYLRSTDVGTGSSSFRDMLNEMVAHTEAAEL